MNTSLPIQGTRFKNHHASPHPAMRHPVVGLLLAAVVFSGGMTSAADTPEMAIVVNKAAALDSASSQDLARAFLDQSNKIDRVRYKVVNLKDKDLRFGFMERLTGMAAAEIDEHFVQLELRAEGNWPAAVSEPAELVRLVAASKSVVGWLPAADLAGLTEKQRAVLKVIAIDEKRPGDPGYKLSATGE